MCLQPRHTQRSRERKFHRGDYSLVVAQCRRPPKKHSNICITCDASYSVDRRGFSVEIQHINAYLKGWRICLLLFQNLGLSTNTVLNHVPISFFRLVFTTFPFSDPSPRRDAVDDRFQHTLDVLTAISWG